MSRRSVAARRPGGDIVSGSAHTSETARLIAEPGELEGIVPIALPRDHPKWARDRFTVSQATKALIDRIKPVAIKVFGFWDHRVHRLAVESGTIEIDMSGSYRCETSLPALEKRLT